MTYLCKVGPSSANEVHIDKVRLGPEGAKASVLETLPPLPELLERRAVGTPRVNLELHLSDGQ